jgi:hypothetical protein
LIGITKGASVEEVTKILGGKPFSGHFDENGTGEVFWRFHMESKEPNGPGNEYKIYMGTFKQRKLVGGSILPNL